MNEVIKQIEQFGIIPVVVIEDEEDAISLASALCRGGLPCAEVTFRTAAAQKAIQKIHEEFPDMLIGAGTVLTTEQVDKAVQAGAKFIVSPGINPRVVDYCIEKNIPIIPGCITPTEMEIALEKGLKTVKFFPAEPAGGLAMIKAVAAPYTDLKFMPTGGISPKNVKDYLAYDRIIACGGSWMVKAELIRAKEFDKIEMLTKEAVQMVKESRGNE